jgi:3-carboxy-cis,cis-muconate cycloisomerase
MTSGGLIVAEAVMMGLAPYIWGRQVAHDVVYDACRATLNEGAAFVEALLAHPEINGRLTRAEIETLIDPTNYLGAAPAMTRRLLANRR